MDQADINENLSQQGNQLEAILAQNNESWIQDFLCYLYTYRSYLPILTQRHFSGHKVDEWKGYCALGKGISWPSDENDDKMDFRFALLFGDNIDNDSLYDEMKLNHSKYLKNTIISEFERYYSTTDDLSIARQMQGFQIIDDLIRIFGEEKGNVYLSAYYTLHDIIIANRWGGKDAFKADICKNTIYIALRNGYGEATANDFKSFCNMISETPSFARNVMGLLQRKHSIYFDTSIADEIITGMVQFYGGKG